MHRETQIFFAYFTFLLVSLPTIHNSHSAYFGVFKSVGFIQIFAIIIEITVIHTSLESEILRKQKLAIVEQ